MRRTSLVLTASALTMSVLLAGCGTGDDEAPTGQVVATVNGEEITLSELNQELGNAKSENAEEQKQITALALASIVNRYLLSDAAEEQGLDNTPAAAMTKKKAEQLALIDLLNKQFQSSAPKPSAEEARQFVNDNPQTFSKRENIIVQQLIVPVIDQAVVLQMEPLDTLDEIEQLLANNNIEYTSTFGTVDTLTIPPAAAEQLAQLRVNDVYVTPQGKGVRVNEIREKQASPLSGDAAIKIAQEMLGRQRAGGMVQSQIQSILQAGQENVNYGEGYGPPKQRQAAPPPAEAGDAEGDGKPADGGNSNS